MIIGEALPADAPDIARVHIDSWRSTYRGIIPDEHLAGLSLERRTEIWTANLERPEPGEFTLAARDTESGIVGFASGGPERSGDPEFTGELYAMYLLSAYQRRGIGGQLIREVARRLFQAGHTSMLVWVLEENPACAFYSALGGRRMRRKTVTLGGKELVELGFGWEDLGALARGQHDAKKEKTMTFPTDRYRSVIESFYGELTAVDETITKVRPAEDAWALIEIVGHLIDSASNNHQRFVRLQFGNLDQLPGYAAEDWIRVQSYRNGDWRETIGLWRLLNNHLLHVIETMDMTALGNTWLHDGEKLPLEHIVTDYFRHLEHHIEHFRRRLGEIRESAR